MQINSSELIYQSSKDIKSAYVATIAIPTFNRPELIKEAIETVINQNIGDLYEVIIIDNCSEEGFFEMLKKYVENIHIKKNIVLKLYRNSKNLGMFGNWNKCIELSNSEWISILNDDDLIDTNFLKVMLDNREGKKLIVCSQKKFGLKAEKSIFRKILNNTKLILERVLRGHKYDYTIEDMLYAGPTAGSLGILMNKDCAIKLNGYNQEHWPTADYEFVYRYWKKFGITKLNAIYAYYRIDDNTSLKLDTLKGFIKNEYLLRLKMLQENIPAGIRRQIYLYFIKISSANYAVFYKNMNIAFEIRKELRSLKLEKYMIKSLFLARVRSLFLYILFSIFSFLNSKEKI